MDRPVTQLVPLAFDEHDPGAERAHGHEGVVGLGSEVRPGGVPHREDAGRRRCRARPLPRGPPLAQPVVSEARASAGCAG